MLQFVVRRLLFAVPTLLAVMTMVFVLVRIVPGDPAQTILGDQASAEALQIMDQRVISTSAVRCVGATLILQGRVYSPPYHVTAIGDPQRLTEALDTSTGVQLYRYYADTYGLDYGTEQLDDVRLPGYDGSLDLLHAAPA